MKIPYLRLHLIFSNTIEIKVKAAEKKARKDQRELSNHLVAKLLRTNAKLTAVNAILAKKAIKQGPPKIRKPKNDYYTGTKKRL